MRKPPTSPILVCPEKRKRVDQGQGAARVRSASTGRDKKSGTFFIHQFKFFYLTLIFHQELHARYWAFLFGNLQRAVDEIYQTCESDESVSQCKEVMMVLDTYCRDFRNLIDWFKIKWDYETKPPPQRPVSLAWEIRKSSPGKFHGMRTTEPSLVEAVRRKNPFQDSANSSKTSSTVNSGDESSISDQVVESTERIETPKFEMKEETPRDEMKVDVIYEERRECEMVDEVCQTDREEDVDENGPKYRSVSLQTCPELALAEEKPKDEKSKQSKTAIGLTAKTQNKQPVTTPAVKPAWGAPRATAPGRSAPTRPAYATVSRQPWGARPLPTTPNKQTASANRLTRSRTVGEVRSGRFCENSSASQRPQRPVSITQVCVLKIGFFVIIERILLILNVFLQSQMGSPSGRPRPITSLCQKPLGKRLPLNDKSSQVHTDLCCVLFSKLAF